MIVAVVERLAAAPERLNQASLEAIAAARQLGKTLELPVSAAVLLPPDGTADETCLGPVLAQKLDRVFVARHPALAAYDPEVWVPSLVQVLGQAAPRFVLLPHTYQARDFAPKLATRMGSGLISGVTGFRAVDGRVLFTRPVFQGKLHAEVSFSPGNSGERIGFVTIQIGAFRAEGAPDEEDAGAARPGSSAVPVTEVAVTPPPSRLFSGPVFQETRKDADLAQAPRIVSVGRGIGEPKNLELVRQLASALGAELAASRPICDAGWLPMDRQIGSSGQTVAPKLYLAVGISGAIQHLVGMKGAHTIVAINKDPEAPIFEVADYGIVGDLFQVVPALIAALRSSG